MFPVTVDAHRLRVHGCPFTGNTLHPSVLEHLQGLRQSLIFIGDQRSGLAARHQAAVSLITPIGKNLLAGNQAKARPRPDQLAARQPHQN